MEIEWGWPPLLLKMHHIHSTALLKSPWHPDSSFNLIDPRLRCNMPADLQIAAIGDRTLLSSWNSTLQMYSQVDGSPNLRVRYWTGKHLLDMDVISSWIAADVSLNWYGGLLIHLASTVVSSFFFSSLCSDEAYLWSLRILTLSLSVLVYHCIDSCMNVARIPCSNNQLYPFFGIQLTIGITRGVTVTLFK